MSINTDRPLSVWAPVASGLDRHGAEARQGRWMLELERGLAAVAKRPGPKTEPEPVPTGATNQPLRPVVPGAVAGSAGAAPGGAVSAGAAPGQEPLRPDANRRTPLAAAAAAAAAGDDKAQTTSAPALALPPSAAGQSGSQAPHGTTSAALLPRHVGAAVDTAANGAPFPGVPSAAAGAAAPGSAVIHSRSAPEPHQNVRSAASLASQSAGAQAIEASPADLSAPAAGEAGDYVAPESHDAEQAKQSELRLQRGERPEFDRRLLNIYVKHDGVHAFIRDTAIGAHQARQVARAISNEIASAGHALAELTVNGRRIERDRIVGGGKDDAMANGEPAGAAGSDAAAPFLHTYDSTHRLFRKGTPE